MKNKLLFIFLIFALNCAAQDTIIVRNDTICQAFWQIFESDSLLFYFENDDGKFIDFHTVITHVDTLADDIVETENFDFQSDGYIVLKYQYKHDDISQMLFIYKSKRIEKIGFYIETYDNTGSFAGEALLFWAVYR